jgi:hypothetical protein
MGIWQRCEVENFLFDELRIPDVIVEKRSLFDVERLRKVEITSDLERTTLYEEVG